MSLRRHYVPVSSYTLRALTTSVPMLKIIYLLSCHFKTFKYICIFRNIWTYYKMVRFHIFLHICLFIEIYGALTTSVPVESRYLWSPSCLTLCSTWRLNTVTHATVLTETTYQACLFLLLSERWILFFTLIAMAMREGHTELDPSLICIRVRSPSRPTDGECPDL